MSKRTIEQRIADADARGSRWLADGNEAAERGDKARAEQCYALGQYWLDRSNNLRGCGSLPESETVIALRNLVQAVQLHAPNHIGLTQAHTEAIRALAKSTT